MRNKLLTGDDVELAGAGSSRRRLLVGAAAVSGAAWVVPGVATADVAVGMVSDAPLSCDGVVKTLYVKYDPSEDPAFGNVGDGATQCLAAARDSDPSSASKTEVSCVLAQLHLLSSVRHDDAGDIDQVTIVLPPPFTAEDIVTTAVKGGTTCGMDRETVSSDQTTLTFPWNEDRKNISHVEFAMRACVPTACADVESLDPGKGQGKK